MPPSIKFIDATGADTVSKPRQEEAEPGGLPCSGAARLLVMTWYVVACGTSRIVILDRSNSSTARASPLPTAADSRATGSSGAVASKEIRWCLLHEPNPVPNHPSGRGRLIPTCTSQRALFQTNSSVADELKALVRAQFGLNSVYHDANAIPARFRCGQKGWLSVMAFSGQEATQNLSHGDRSWNRT